MRQHDIVDMIHQYLVEQGLQLSAMALAEEYALEESSSSAAPVDLNGQGAPPASGRLMRIINEWEASRQRSTATGQRAVEETELMSTPDGVFCAVEVGQIENHHDKNLTCCAMREDGLLVTGAADRCVKQVSVGGLPDVAAAESHTLKTLPVSSPVLCLDVNPKCRDIAAVGEMSGAASIVSLATGEVLCTLEPAHKKYLVRLRWSRCGRYLATASYDHTVHVFGVEGDIGDDHRAVFSSMTLLKDIPLPGSAECFCFVQGSDGATTELVIGCRDDHRLHIYALPSMERRFVNMNEFGDAHVSFRPMDITVSPNGNYYLISTDKDHLLMMNRQTNKVVRRFYGTTNDEYSNPRHRWHPSGHYFYTTSGNNILVFEVASQRVVHTLQGHTGVVRDIWFDKTHDVLVSVGYDRAVRFWAADSLTIE